MEEVKITNVVSATRLPMIKSNKLEEKRELDIRILEYGDKNFLVPLPRSWGTYIYVFAASS